MIQSWSLDPGTATSTSFVQSQYFKNLAGIGGSTCGFGGSGIGITLTELSPDVWIL